MDGGGAEGSSGFRTAGPWLLETRPSYQPYVAPKRSRKGRWLAVLALLVAGAAAFVIIRRVRDDGDHYPARWDPQVAPIAASVEQLRGLTFKHPVSVTYLSEQDFRKRFAVSNKQSKEQQQSAADIAALYRAFGLTGPHVDVVGAFSTTAAAGVVGYYDLPTRSIFIRGKGALDAFKRVTLAHELTHVLQDQYFDLQAKERAAATSKSGLPDVLRALVEGDAVRIERGYLRRQSRAVIAEYERELGQLAKKAEPQTASVPAAIRTDFEMPYDLGPGMVEVIAASGGNRAVDRALTGEPGWSNLLFDPTSDARATSALPRPGLKAGESAHDLRGDNGVLDGYELYLTLAAHVDIRTAMQFVEPLVAGSERVYRAGHTTCFRGRVATSVRGLSDLSGFERWVASLPGAAIDPYEYSATYPDTITFHVCDPGARARAPADKAIATAAYVLATRLEVQAAAMQQGAQVDLARCSARLFVLEPDVLASIAEHATVGTLTEQMRREIVGDSILCTRDARAGIPGD